MMIYSRFVFKPGCELESECGTKKKICALTRTFGAPHNIISNPGSTWLMLAARVRTYRGTLARGYRELGLGPET